MNTLGRDVRLVDHDGTDVVLRDAELLGRQTSHRNSHRHPAGTVARPGEPCPACRWFEVEIYRHRDGYALVTVGKTQVTGEVDRLRVRTATSPYEVVELLTQHFDDGRPPRLPRASALALARAAERDDGIRDAYVNRAVA